MQTLTIDLSTKYIAESWVDPRVQCRSSSISGKGLFASEPIKQGEAIIIWGGRIYLEADIKAGLAREHSIATIGERVYLGSPPDTREGLDEFMNHSCSPNVWLQDEVTLVTMRDIVKHEELTLDYALFETDPRWAMECYCGSPICRYLVSGRDWEQKYLQVKYRGHFSPYINERIEIGIQYIWKG